MPNTEGLKEGEGSLFPFDLSQVGSPPQKVFDILQEDVSEEAFYDKPSWVDPENDACNLPLSQPACSFSRLFFQLGWGFLLSLCVWVHLPERPASTLCSLCKIWQCLRKYSCSLGQEIPRLFKRASQKFQLGTHSHLHKLIYVMWTVWEVLHSEHSYGRFCVNYNDEYVRSSSIKVKCFKRAWNFSEIH